MSDLKFVIHDLGDWERDELNTRSTRVGGSVAEFDSVESIPNEFDRKQIGWMLDHGEPVTQCGNTVYQIRRAA